jgi:hypothetical protein
MGDSKSGNIDPLARQRTFPDAAEIFRFSQVPLETALAEGIIVLDTNVLLVPYGTGKASVEQIRTTYSRLAGENRLRVPGQVAREFAANRADKLKTLYHQLSIKRSVSVTNSEYPLLEGLKEYEVVREAEAKLVAALNTYRDLQKQLLTVVSGWTWNDPISVLYREIFDDAVVSDFQIDDEKVLKDLRYRFENLVPPGYKDSNNEHAGIGDYLIWLSILGIGKSEKKHIVFVSGDEKSDWWYRSDNTALYPRYELVDEFRRESQGQSFFIISFAELLRHFGAPATIVEEVREEEQVASILVPANPVTWERPWITTVRTIRRWIRETYPQAELEISGNEPINFWVYRASGHRFGVDIRNMNGSLTSDRIEYIAHHISSIHRLGDAPILAVARIEDLDKRDEVLNRLGAETKGSNVAAVVVGMIENDRFVELGRIDHLPL